MAVPAFLRLRQSNGFKGHSELQSEFQDRLATQTSSQTNKPKGQSKRKVLRVVCLLESLWLRYLRKKGRMRTPAGTPAPEEHTKGTCNSTSVPGIVQWERACPTCVRSQVQYLVLPPKPKTILTITEIWKLMN